MASLFGLPVGLLLGFVVHRGDFCMQSAVKEIVEARPGRQVSAYAIALALQLVVVNILTALGWLVPSLPGVRPAAALAGGTVFGIGMVLAKG